MKKLLLVGILALCIVNGYTYYQSEKWPVYDFVKQISHDGFVKAISEMSGRQMQTAENIFHDLTAQPPALVRIYKWTDANGVVHYENQSLKGATEISIDPNANILPMADVPSIESLQKPAVDTAAESEKNIERIREGIEARVGI